MKTLALIQGSDIWKEARDGYRTASEASIVSGHSKNVKRDELIHMRATGTDQEFSAWFQKNILDKGHAVEAVSRPFAEKIIGEELYPVTGIDDADYYLASFDGLTMAEDACWECKQWNAEKAASVRAGELPKQDYWQVVQQLVVSGADNCLYMVSDGTEEGSVFMWFELTDADRNMLDQIWLQFDQDLEAYKAKLEAGEIEPKKVAPAGTAPDSLPTLRIELTGAVSTTNLPEFKERALAIIDDIKTELITDEDFSSADMAVKFLSKGEKQLEDAKSRALEQTASIDELFKTIDELKDAMRTKRLALDKLVKAEKENRRIAILTNAKQAMDKHVGDLEKAMEAQANCSVSMPAINADFAGAMKGKKTISSLESAANDTLATAKIEANQIANIMRTNIAVLNEQVEYGFLFSDYQQLLTKASDDLNAVVKSRIADHKEAQAKKEAEDRERIRQEEAAKLKAEQDRKEAEAVNPEPEQPAKIGVDLAKPGADRTVQQVWTTPDKPAGSNAPTNDKVFNIAVNAVSSYFNVTPAEAVDLLDAIDFSERKAS